MNNQKGFTLIELMIVIAIIAILAAIALPAYNNYVARSQASEAVSLAASFKTPVGLFVTDEGDCPSNTSEGFTNLLDNSEGDVGQFVESLTFATVEGSKCSITAKMGKDANSKIKGDTLTFTSSAMVGKADSGNGIAKWTCTSDMDEKFLPKTCKG